MTKRTLLAALFIMAVAGLLLHLRIHPFLVPDKVNPALSVFNPTNFFAFIFPLVDVVLVTALFMSRRTAVYGYVLNGLIVIYGTVFMAHFSIAQFIAQAVPPSKWILNSTLPDIGMAWADFFVGKALFDFYTGRK